MTISGNIPSHLISIAKTGFLTAPRKPVAAYSQIATLVKLDEKNGKLVDLGNAPMPKRNRGRLNFDEIIERALAVEPVDMELPVTISRNAVNDDQTGTLLARARSAGANYDRYYAQQAFKTLNDGDDSTIPNSIGYDGLPLFSNSHVDKGAKYTTVQDNLDNNALALAAFNSQYAKAMQVRDETGEFTNYTYDLLVASPADRVTANQICNVGGGSDDPTKANPNKGVVSYVITPMFDSGAWVLAASGESTKPIIIVEREAPHLPPEMIWFDPEGPDGGQYCFNFVARVNFYVGDWRLVQMGKT